MQEPSSVILPDGTVITQETDEPTLYEIRAQIVKKRWASWQVNQCGTDPANTVLYRWGCRKHGSHPDWDFEEAGIGPPLHLREVRPTRTSVADDRGLLCIIDPDAYTCTDGDWDEFQKNLLEQIKVHRALVCDLGHGANWDTEVSTKHINIKHNAFRCANGPIFSTKGKFTICGAESLFFYRPEVPHMVMIGLEFDVKPGSYNCTFVQLRPPDYLHPDYENWQNDRQRSDPEVIVQLLPDKKPRGRGCAAIIWEGESRQEAKTRRLEKEGE
jgi:hypothetical protein